MNIVFGGSFNPPTLAHDYIINFLLDQFSPDNLIILPVGDNYLKKDLAPEHDRYEMLLLATKKMEKVRVLSTEFNNPFAGTYATLQELSKTYDDLLYVIGADNLLSLDKWINFPLLIRDYKFIVFGRNGIDVGKTIEEKYSEYRHQFIVFDLELPISSTDVRKRVLASNIKKEVYEYIVKNHLYEVIK